MVPCFLTLSKTKDGEKRVSSIEQLPPKQKKKLKFHLIPYTQSIQNRLKLTPEASDSPVFF